MASPVSGPLLSELSIVLHALDLIIVRSEWLPDIVGVGGVLCGTFFLSACVSLGQDLTTGSLVLLHHLNGEDVIDLDVVSRHAVVQEVRWEHHIVTSIPELRLILLVERQHVTRSDEAESGEDHVGAEEPNKEARVIERSVLDTDKS